MSAKLLVVDDILANRRLMQAKLEAKYYTVLLAENGQSALEMAREEQPDIILLDVMMPGEDGISLCSSIARLTHMPVIFLSALTDEVDRIVGLEVGADDYVCKPFHPRELLARIRSVLRRADRIPGDPDLEEMRYVEFAGWAFDVARRALKGEDGLVVSLSSSEFELLKIFLGRPQIVLSRERILELLHSGGTEVFDRSVDSQISRFRRKIERDPKKPEIIKTVWGGGYMFAAEVKRL